MNFNKVISEPETVPGQKWEDWHGFARMRGYASHSPDPALKVLSPNWDMSRPPILDSPNTNSRFDQRTKPCVHSTPPQTGLNCMWLTMFVYLACRPLSGRWSSFCHVVNTLKKDVPELETVSRTEMKDGSPIMGQLKGLAISK